MAKSRPVEVKPKGHKKRVSKVDDEEISEDGAFNEDDKAKYEHFFQSKKQKQPEETGELWDYLFEGAADPDEASIPLKNEQDSVEKAEPKRRKKEVLDEGFNRVEEDENLFTEDAAKEDARDFSWVLDADDKNGKYANLLKRFKEIHQDLPEVFRQESRAKISREERKELYESIKKDVSKRWEPILQHLKRKRHMVYGEPDERVDPTYGSITNLEAETPLEKELENEISVAYERALRAREVREQKRINRIKSKKWHKRQKQRDLELYAKLIQKSNDPELTKSLLESFEQKRSKHRILRKKAAQQKWAKLAMRFGDRSVLKEISSEQQKLKDDLSFIKNTIESVKQRQGLDSDESEQEESDDSDDEEPKDEVLEKLKIIANPREEDIPQKGLFALKFMKDMIQAKIDGQDQDTSHTNRYASDQTENEDYDEDISCSDSDTDTAEESSNNDKTAATTKMVSDEEFKEAMKQIQFALGGRREEEQSDACAATPETKIQTTKLNMLWGSTKTATTEVRAAMSAPDVPDDVASTADKAPEQPGLKRLVEEALPNIMNEDDGLDNFIKNLAPAKKPEKTMEVARQLFVTRPDEEAYLSGDETEEEEEDSDKLKGWGSWTGYGIVSAKKEKKEPEKPAKQKAKVKVSNKKDPKLAKYLLHRVPHPYKNKNDYNSKMEVSIGPEWNTSKMHSKLVQPKTTVKIGTIVKPLSAEGAKEYVKRMGKTFNRSRTHARL